MVETDGTLDVTVATFETDALIPVGHSADGHNASPALNWGRLRKARCLLWSLPTTRCSRAQSSQPHDDAVAAYKYVVENAQQWNGDSDRIAVAGESTGGKLALNVAIAARDQRLTAPDAVLAVVSDSCIGRSRSSLGLRSC